MFDEANKVTGIYMIKNLHNDKIYIGQSVNIKKRWEQHIKTSKNKRNKSYKYPLYKEMRIYGIDAFQFSILEICEEPLLNQQEIYWIEKYEAFKNPSHYNRTAGGRNVSPKFKRKRRKRR